MTSCSGAWAATLSPASTSSSSPISSTTRRPRRRARPRPAGGSTRAAGGSTPRVASAPRFTTGCAPSAMTSRGAGVRPRHGPRPRHTRRRVRRLHGRGRPPLRRPRPRPLSGTRARDRRPRSTTTVTLASWNLRRSRTCATPSPPTTTSPTMGLATAVFLAVTLRRPLLLEGEAGVGKTELAKVLAAWTGGELVRLQCYEGIDAAQAVYEWDYSRQLLHLRAQEARRRRRPSRTSCTPSGSSSAGRSCGPSPPRAVPRRRCCSSTRSTGPTTSSRRSSSRSSPTTRSPSPSWARSAPSGRPIVVVTSNRTRDVHDALKRRCLYHWIEHPDFERELAILRVRAPEVGEALARQVAAAVEALRDLDLYKPPGVAETIDWAQAVAALGADTLDEDTIERDARRGLKYREDQQRVRAHGLGALVAAGRRPRWPEPAWTPTGSSSRSPGWLRRLGLEVPVGATVTLGQAWAAVGLGARDDVYWAGRTSCCRRPEDAAPLRPGVRCLLGRPGRAAVDATTPVASVTVGLDDCPTTTDADPTGTTSPRTRTGDAAACGGARPRCCAAATSPTCSRDELDEARRLIADLRLVAARRRSRRHRASPPRSGAGPTCAGPSAASLRAGGEPIRRAFEPAPSERPRRVVLLCDVSGSMEPYARALRAVPPHRGRRRHPRRGVRARHPSHPAHPRAVLPRPRRGARRGRPVGHRLVGRHPARRRASGRSTTSGASGPGPRRDRRDPLRRLGPRRPRPARRARWPACAASRTGSCGSTR